MAETSPPFPVKFFIAVLFNKSEALNSALLKVTELWGPVDFQGKDHLFDVTDYYEPEMGTPLYRRLLSFESLYEPTLMVEMKLGCNRIEQELSIDRKRIVNLDAGYLDHNKVLLASAKEAGQKVYIDKGIYADLAGRYKSGRYQPFEWSFPDFRDGRYDSELLSIRSIYIKQMKKWRLEKKK
ncbi:MAG: DUF4416 family protein [Fibrobacter sp.]|nr:DUF4416 family protein [Fibrobacter sp.]